MVSGEICGFSRISSKKLPGAISVKRKHRAEIPNNRRMDRVSRRPRYLMSKLPLIMQASTPPGEQQTTAFAFARDLGHEKWTWSRLIPRCVLSTSRRFDLQGGQPHQNHAR